VLEGVRPMRPVSGLGTGPQPLFAWTQGPRADGARLELCEDRACSRVLQARDVLGRWCYLDASLPPGTYYWRVWPTRGGVRGAQPSVTWRFLVCGSEGTTCSLPEESWTVPSPPDQQCPFPPSPISYTARLSVRPLGDLNGDGYVDLISFLSYETRDCGGYYGSTGTIIGSFYGGPSGVEGPGPRFGGSFTDHGMLNGSRFVSAGDYDGDGLIDVMMTSLSSSDPATSVVWGDQGRMLRCASRGIFREVFLDDTDGDFINEIACPNSGDQTYEIYSETGGQLVPRALPGCDALGIVGPIRPSWVTSRRPVLAGYADLYATFVTAAGREERVVWHGGPGGLSPTRCERAALPAP
jgi:hypothetical protein